MGSARFLKCNWIAFKMQKSVNIETLAARNVVNGKKIKDILSDKLNRKIQHLKTRRTKHFLLLFSIAFISFCFIHYICSFVLFECESTFITFSLLSFEFRILQHFSFLPASVLTIHSWRCLHLSRPIPLLPTIAYFPNDTVLQPETINFPFDASFAPFSKLLLFIVLT